MLKNWLFRWFKEPVVHFLIAGGGLFALYNVMNPEQPRRAQVVMITEQELNWVRQTWTAQWQRQPDEREFLGLVAGYLKETLLAREAHELGMAQDDVVVRRRLAQKMEFLVQDTARLRLPEEMVLRQYYQVHINRYHPPEKVAFNQIFFTSPERANAALASIESNARDSLRDPSIYLGDPSVLPSELSLSDAQAINSQFGPGFSQQIFGLELDQWQGPVMSAYGAHLVRITHRPAPDAHTFEAARARVVSDWQNAQQERVEQDYLRSLIKKYDIQPDPQIRPLVEAALQEEQ